MFKILNHSIKYTNINNTYKSLVTYNHNKSYSLKLINYNDISILKNFKKFFTIDYQYHLNNHIYFDDYIKNTNLLDQYTMNSNLQNTNEFNYYIPFIKSCSNFFKQYYYNYDLLTGNLDFTFLTHIKNMGLNNTEINNFIKIIQSQFESYNLKQNNRISILIIHPKLFKNHIYDFYKIIGFKIFNKNKNYFGFLANNGKFYDENGKGLDSIFLKFPSFNNYRISSQFNLHRFHPIKKKISPHQGVDLAMPLGTPVLSVSNGIVINTRSSIQAGKYIAIQHNINYITKYMHLKQILVKVGDKVKIGQTIGLSGSTGFSTGPHLHYEIWFKNKAINPVLFNTSEQLQGQNLKNYLCFSNEIINKFNNNN